MPIAKTCKQNLTEKRFCTTSTPDCKCYAHKRLVCNACETCVSSTFNKLQKSQNRKIARTKIYLRWFGMPTQYEQRDFCILRQYCTKQKRHGSTNPCRFSVDRCLFVIVIVGNRCCCRNVCCVALLTLHIHRVLAVKMPVEVTQNTFVCLPCHTCNPHRGCTHGCRKRT